MEHEEKIIIAKKAQQLILCLDLCDDAEFVDFIIHCIASNDEVSIDEYIERG